MIGVSRDLSGFAYKGTTVRTSADELVSGSTTYRDGFILSVTVNGHAYSSTVIATISDKLIDMWPLSNDVWRPGSWKVAVVGLPETKDYGVMQGSISVAAARAEWNLSLGLMGFTGFNSLAATTIAAGEPNGDTPDTEVPVDTPETSVVVTPETPVVTSGGSAPAFPLDTNQGGSGRSRR